MTYRAWKKGRECEAARGHSSGAGGFLDNRYASINKSRAPICSSPWLQRGSRKATGDELPREGGERSAKRSGATQWLKLRERSHYRKLVL